MTLEQAKVYSDRFSQAKYLVIVNGMGDEVPHAKYILNDHTQVK